MSSPSIKAFTLAALLVACIPPSKSVAAHVEGFGSISSNVAPLQVDQAYQHPQFLDVARTRQFTPSDLGNNGHETMAYTGQAQFGRLGATAFVGGAHANTPNLSVASDISMSFHDRITANTLSPLIPTYLRLDVDLSGTMSRGDQIFGNSSGAFFGIQQISATDPEHFSNLANVQFTWFGANFLINNTTDPGSATQGFVPYPGEEPAFEEAPGPAHHSFGARGYVDVPLNASFGPSFLLIVSMKASVSTNTDNTFADSNFGNTVLIGNARIVDQNGIPIPTASFTSESGYDYITPPPPIPEPATFAIVSLAATCVLSRRRR